MWYETNEMGSTVVVVATVGVAGGGLGRLMKVPRLRTAAAVADVEAKALVQRRSQLISVN